MPQRTFDVTAPDGRTFELTGDHAPTETELRDIFAKLPPKAPTPSAPTARTWTDMAVDFVPAAGAMVGGALGVEAGPVGIALGSGAGGALGKAVQQKIQVMRGQADAPATVLEALKPVAVEGVTDAAIGGVTGIAGKVAQIPAVAGKIASVGQAVERLGASAEAKRLSEGGAILEGLINHDWRGALAAYSIPPLLRGAGRVISTAGQALERSGAKAAPAAVANLADDVALIRESVAKGMLPATAVKIVANGSAEYADTLLKGFHATLRQQGPPIPEAVQRLLETASFRGLPR